MADVRVSIPEAKFIPASFQEAMQQYANVLHLFMTTGVCLSHQDYTVRRRGTIPLSAFASLMEKCAKESGRPIIFIEAHTDTNGVFSSEFKITQKPYFRHVVAPLLMGGREAPAGGSNYRLRQYKDPIVFRATGTQWQFLINSSSHLHHFMERLRTDPQCRKIMMLDYDHPVGGLPTEVT